MPRRSQSVAPEPPLPMPPAPAQPIDAVSMKRRIVTLPIDQVGPSPLQPRQHIVESDRDELMQSIKIHGVIEPLVVRERPPHQSDDARFSSVYELVAGEQRWTTAKRAGVEEVDVVVRELTDAQVIEFGLVENLRRTDLHPMDEAAAYERLSAMNPSYTDDALADRVGKDVSTIRKRRKLLRLIPDCRAAFLSNAITVKHAEKLSTVPATQQHSALRHCFSSLLIWDEDPTAEKLLTGQDTTTPAEVQAAGIVAALVWNQRWDLLAQALKSVGDLDEWIADHTRADISDRDTQQQLGLELPPKPEWAEPAQHEEAVEDALASLLQLSESDSYAFTTKEAKAVGVVHRAAWKEITKDKNACDYVQRGAVVHGGPLRLVDRVCVSRKCEKHWPKPTPKPATGQSAADRQAEQDKRDADRLREEGIRKAWEANRPKLAAAFAAHVATLKVSVDLIKARFDHHELAYIKKEFGVVLAPTTIGQFLACGCVGTYHRDLFARSAKVFGFDLAKAEAKLVPKAEGATAPAAASKKVSKPAAKKPAKKAPAKAAKKAKAAKGAAPKKGKGRK